MQPEKLEILTKEETYLFYTIYNLLPFYEDKILLKISRLISSLTEYHHTYRLSATKIVQNNYNSIFRQNIN